MYTSGMYQVELRQRDGDGSIDLNSTGDWASWTPIVPHRIRMVAAIIDNDIGATGTINFDRLATIGGTRTHDVIAALALTTAHTGGKIVYRDNLDVVVNPGQEFVVAIDDATAASDTALVILLVEPVYDRPANFSQMVASA